MAVQKNSEPPVDPEVSASPAARDRFRDQLGSRQNPAGDGETETSLWHGNYSPKALMGPSVLAAIVSISLLTVTVIYAVPSWLISLGLIAVLWVAVAGTYLVRRASIHYELTNQRFMHQSGLVRRRTDRIEVIDIDDVSFVQGPVERLLGIGTIEITSSDRSHPLLVMPGIPDVRQVAGMIDDVRRRERKRRSVHIQTM